MDMTRTAALIPDAALKKHIAVLGTNGSGKTSVAKSQIVEPALRAGERVCCIDPTGVMWGIRLGTDGKPRGGLMAYIVGGEHADFPLTKRDGAAWAEIVGTSSDSFVFDTSLMTVTDRTQWFTDFAQALLRYNKGPLRLILDEAHLFAPQAGAKSGGLAPEMLHAANNLLALGRSKGLRITMISQRPAKLHKDSLSQAHTLIAMKLIAPQDRKAISEWVLDQTDPESGKELIASLPSLGPGEGWVWAPAENILERVRFPRPTTYDSSRAPDENEGDAPALAKIDPAAITGRLATVAAEAEANDPAKLRRRIAELERAKPLAPPVVDTAALEAASYKKGYEDGVRAGVAFEGKRLTEALASLVAAPTEAVVAPAPRQIGAKAAPAPIQREAKQARASAESDGTVTGPQTKVLGALAWWRAMGKDKPLRTQVAAICGWAASSGHLKNVLGSLSSAGLITYPAPGQVQMTPEGAALAPEPDMSLTVIDGVRAVLSGPQRALFEALLPGGETPMDRAALAEAVGWATTSGHLKNTLGSLSTLQVVHYPSKGTVALSDWLFN